MVKTNFKLLKRKKLTVIWTQHCYIYDYKIVKKKTSEIIEIIKKLNFKNNENDFSKNMYFVHFPTLITALIYFLKKHSKTLSFYLIYNILPLLYMEENFANMTPSPHQYTSHTQTKQQHKNIYGGKTTKKFIHVYVYILFFLL